MALILRPTLSANRMPSRFFCSSSFSHTLNFDGKCSLTVSSALARPSVLLYISRVSDKLRGVSSKYLPWNAASTRALMSSSISTEAFRESKVSKEYGSVQIQVYVRLGEMMPLQIWETTLDPGTRILKQSRVEDVAEANIVFSSLMGARVDTRKELIQNSASIVNVNKLNI